MQISQGSAALRQHYAGEVGKSINAVLQIVSVYCVPNFIGIGESL